MYVDLARLEEGEGHHFASKVGIAMESAQKGNVSRQRQYKSLKYKNNMQLKAI